MVVVTFLPQGCGKAKWDVLTLPKRGAEGSEKPARTTRVLVRDCVHAGAPRPPPWLQRALGHGEYPRRHLNEFSQAQQWVLHWDSIWDEPVEMEEGWMRWQAQRLGAAEGKGRFKNQSERPWFVAEWEGQSVKSAWRCHSPNLVPLGCCREYQPGPRHGLNHGLEWKRLRFLLFDEVSSSGGTGHLALPMSEDNPSNFKQHNGWEISDF